MRFIRHISAPILALFLAVAALAQTTRSQLEPGQSPADAPPAPKMVIDSLSHDFGEVKAGVPLVHVFKLKNMGKGDLLIKNVSPG